MTLPSNNVRDYPAMTRTANEMFAEINDRSPYAERDTKKLIVVRSYYIDGPCFVAEYNYSGTVRAMSIEFGSRGRSNGLPKRKNPPAENILEWMKQKGINVARRRRSMITGRFIRSYNLRQIAYAIAHTIGERGTVGKGWGQELAERIFNEWNERFSEAFVQDIDYQIKKYFPELTK